MLENEEIMGLRGIDGYKTRAIGCDDSTFSKLYFFKISEVRKYVRPEDQQSHILLTLILRHSDMYTEYIALWNRPLPDCLLR